jgi:hypothetical protein
VSDLGGCRQLDTCRQLDALLYEEESLSTLIFVASNMEVEYCKKLGTRSKEIQILSSLILFREFLRRRRQPIFECRSKTFSPFSIEYDCFCRDEMSKYRVFEASIRMSLECRACDEYRLVLLKEDKSQQDG